MVKTYDFCLDCKTTNKKDTCSLCDICRKSRRIEKLKMANENKHKAIGKIKQCKNCDLDFLTLGPASLYCKFCKEKVTKEKLKGYQLKSELKRGTKVGIGSGNYFGKFNVNHPSYKNGVTWYRDIALQKGNTCCERCLGTLDFSNQYMWCVHHIDHNRSNNSVENLELLCKRCHQLEHNCIDNLPNK